MKAPKKPTGRKRIDWEAVERDYRTGKYSQRELAVIHGTNEATLSRKIKADQALDPARWQRDLTEEVRQATNARLMSELVKSEIKEGQEKVKESVKVAAEMNVQVILGHQAWLSDLAADMKAARAKLLELGAEVDDVRQAATLVTALESSARTLKIVIEGQRKVFGLDDQSGGGGTGFEDLVSDLPEAGAAPK